MFFLPAKRPARDSQHDSKDFWQTATALRTSLKAWRWYEGSLPLIYWNLFGPQTGAWPFMPVGSLVACVAGKLFSVWRRAQALG